MGVRFPIFANDLRRQCHANSQTSSWRIWSDQFHVNFGIVPCTPFRVFNYNAETCEHDDMVVETARLRNALGYISTIYQLYDTLEDCLDVDAFRKVTEAYFAPDGLMLVRSGGGVYNSSQHIGDFFANYHPHVNRGAYTLTLDKSETKPRVSTCGNIIYVDTYQELYVSRRDNKQWCYVEDGVHLEWMFEYTGCSEVVQRLQLREESDQEKKTDLDKVLLPQYHITTGSKSWGLSYICQVHDTYCKEDNQQFSTNSECLDFMTSVPQASSSCESGGIVVGNSSSCRAKFTHMVPLYPDIYCPILGRTGLSSFDTPHLSCHDFIQCDGANATLSPPEFVDIYETPPYRPCLLENVQQFTSIQDQNIC